jgi:hypothetical protein
LIPIDEDVRVAWHLSGNRISNALLLSIELAPGGDDRRLFLIDHQRHAIVRFVEKYRDSQTEEHATSQCSAEDLIGDGLELTLVPAGAR